MEQFDPYRKWLGIPPQEQPPHHYRLLGLALFEPDPDVIANAADRQMFHVRTFQSGRYSEASQFLLNELAVARLCLLDPLRKAQYDAELRQRLALRTERPVASPPPPRVSQMPGGAYGAPVSTAALMPPYSAPPPAMPSPAGPAPGYYPVPPPEPVPGYYPVPAAPQPPTGPMAGTYPMPGPGPMPAQYPMPPAAPMPGPYSMPSTAPMPAAAPTFMPAAPMPAAPMPMPPAAPVSPASYPMTAPAPAPMPAAAPFSLVSPAPGAAAVPSGNGAASVPTAAASAPAAPPVNPPPPPADVADLLGPTTRRPARIVRRKQGVSKEAMTAGIVLGAFALLFLIWIAVKSSGRKTGWDAPFTPETTSSGGSAGSSHASGSNATTGDKAKKDAAERAKKDAADKAKKGADKARRDAAGGAKSSRGTPPPRLARPRYRPDVASPDVSRPDVSRPDPELDGAIGSPDDVPQPLNLNDALPKDGSAPAARAAPPARNSRDPDAPPDDEVGIPR